ncbi:hypothetical protein BDN72DRAFT_634883 [Pluteus cervinus]|uniref:Uncharacterized protein n=1 Tax=Pluteus cervinus TaxID=181527 RepID=A0ACD3BAH0_9AGAR|nr:hypothetical protein BDN72DRAFT_634883 [Pluteus cervinus]
MVDRWTSKFLSARMLGTRVGFSGCILSACCKELSFRSPSQTQDAPAPPEPCPGPREALNHAQFLLSCCTKSTRFSIHLKTETLCRCVAQPNLVPIPERACGCIARRPISDGQTHHLSARIRFILGQLGILMGRAICSFTRGINREIHGSVEGLSEMTSPLFLHLLSSPSTLQPSLFYGPMTMSGNYIS